MRWRHNATTVNTMVFSDYSTGGDPIQTISGETDTIGAMLSLATSLKGAVRGALLAGPGL